MECLQVDVQCKAGSVARTDATRPTHTYCPLLPPYWGCFHHLQSLVSHAWSFHRGGAQHQVPAVHNQPAVPALPTGCPAS